MLSICKLCQTCKETTLVTVDTFRRQLENVIEHESGITTMVLLLSSSDSIYRASFYKESPLSPRDKSQIEDMTVSELYDNSHDPQYSRLMKWVKCIPAPTPSCMSAPKVVLCEQFADRTSPRNVMLVHDIYLKMYARTIATYFTYNTVCKARGSVGMA